MQYLLNIWMIAYNLYCQGAVVLIQSRVIWSGGCEIIDHTYPDQNNAPNLHSSKLDLSVKLTIQNPLHVITV